MASMGPFSICCLMAQKSEKRGSPAHSWRGEHPCWAAAGPQVSRAQPPTAPAPPKGCCLLLWFASLLLLPSTLLLVFQLPPSEVRLSGLLCPHCPLPSALSCHCPAALLLLLLLTPSLVLCPIPLHQLSLQPHLETEVSPQ